MYCLLSATSQDWVRKEFTWEDAVFYNLEDFAIAIAGTIEYPFASGQMVHNGEVLEAITRPTEDRCSLEITENA